MLEGLLMVLGVVILVGFVVGIVAYKPVRNKLIREKGYDADQSGKLLSALSMVALIGGCAAGTNGDSANTGLILLGIGACVALTVFNILRRAKHVGLGSAVLVTLLQMLSMLWLCVVWFVKMGAKMMGGMNHAADGTIARKNADEEKKAALRREYEAKVAEAEGRRDEYLTAAGIDPVDAEIADAEKAYSKEAADVERH